MSIYGAHDITRLITISANRLSLHAAQEIHQDALALPHSDNKLENSWVGTVRCEIPLWSDTDNNSCFSILGTRANCALKSFVESLRVRNLVTCHVKHHFDVNVSLLSRTEVSGMCRTQSPLCDGRSGSVVRTSSLAISFASTQNQILFSMIIQLNFTSWLLVEFLN
jgi:hypothetical protein